MLSLEQGNVFFVHHMTTVTCCIFNYNFVQKGLFIPVVILSENNYVEAN